MAALGFNNIIVACEANRVHVLVQEMRALRDRSTAAVPSLPGGCGHRPPEPHASFW